MSFWKKNIDSSEKKSFSSATINTLPQKDSIPIPVPVKNPEVEWIWVEGYKITDFNGNCKNNFHYEVGQTYTMPKEDVKTCESGFHFCSDIKDLHKFYKLGRVFKVRGLVKKHEFETEIDRSGFKRYEVIISYSNETTTYRTDSKLAAAELEIIEELSWDDFHNYFQDVPWVENKEDWEEFVKFSVEKTNGVPHIEGWYRHNFYKNLRLYDLEDELISILYERSAGKCKRIVDIYTSLINSHISKDTAIDIIFAETRNR